jgi:hypothetical protein
LPCISSALVASPTPRGRSPFAAGSADISFTLTGLAPSTRHAVRLAALPSIGLGVYSWTVEVATRNPFFGIGLPDTVGANTRGKAPTPPSRQVHIRRIERKMYCRVLMDVGAA